MQTFITRVDENQVLAAMLTAEDLDPKRLGKQRVEVKQIYSALTTGMGWVNHPATKMWEGHEQALALYGHVMCSEWIKRGYNDELRPWFHDRYLIEGDDTPDWPWWFADPRMVSTHRSKLMRKLPSFYRDKFEFDILADVYPLPYIWPDAEVEHRWTVSAAEYKKQEYVEPPEWVIHGDRTVTFPAPKIVIDPGVITFTATESGEETADITIKRTPRDGMSL